MQRVTIRLLMAEQVKQFVNIIARYNCEIDLRSGRHVVDAKSILGIFSLDLSRPLTLEIQGEDPEEINSLMAAIKDFVEDIATPPTQI